MVNLPKYLINSAERLPNKIAFCDGTNSLTFAELNKFARALGACLSAVRNRPVAILGARNVYTLAAFMGVLYSGNFYVPIDPALPQARADTMLRRLEPAYVLDDAAIAAALSHEGADPVCGIDVDPAYMLYTSGSTGEPKGIVVSHKSVMDCIEWEQREFGFCQNDIFASQVPFHFDPFVKDFYLTLKCGATTHILPKKHFMFPPKLMQAIDDINATVLMWSTSAFKLVADSGVLAKYAPKNLRLVVFGGERIFAKQLRAWQEALPDVTYVNFYGPTETTVELAYHIIDRIYADDEQIPIGRACGNKEILLLDEAMQPTRRGEIYARGTGLALGYYGETALTDAAFVQNPQVPWRDILYRTGDIAEYNDAGLLMFIGRKDMQIKHHGYRIEPGEIEAAIMAIAEILDAVVLYECGRIVAAYIGEIGGGEILEHLRTTLPKYMHPQEFFQMKDFDKNANGKIDRAAVRRVINESGS